MAADANPMTSVTVAISGNSGTFGVGEAEVRGEDEAEVEDVGVVVGEEEGEGEVEVEPAATVPLTSVCVMNSEVWSGNGWSAS